MPHTVHPYTALQSSARGFQKPSDIEKLTLRKTAKKSVSWESGSWNTCNVASSHSTSRCFPANCKLNTSLNLHIDLATDCSCNTYLFVILVGNPCFSRRRNWGVWRTLAKNLHQFEKMKERQIWNLWQVPSNLPSQVALSWGTGGFQGSRLWDFRPSWRWKWRPRGSSDRKPSKSRSQSRPAAISVVQQVAYDLNHTLQR